MKSLKEILKAISLFFAILLFVWGVAFFASKMVELKEKSNETYTTKQNQSIIDCQSRGNNLDWCLTIFNE